MTYLRMSWITPVLTFLSLAALSGESCVTLADDKEAKPRQIVVEEVSFRDEDHTLSGSLYHPRDAGPNPAIVMILGSDRQDRHFDGAGPAIGRHFARAGFACLLWDKPGVGRSTGDFNAQSLQDRAREALAAVRFLGGRTDIRRNRIGLWGHSQGGMVAPLAASLSPEVAFLIEVSGWQGPAWRQDAVRVEAELRADGFPEADIERAVDFARLRMAMIRGNRPYKDLEDAQNAVKMLPWFRAVHFCDRVRFESARLSVGADSTSWWCRVRRPVLVIYGDRDTSSGPPQPLITIIRRGLEAAGNRDVTVRVFPDADHTLQRARPANRDAGDVRAIDQSKEDKLNFATGYLETMTDWLAKKAGATGEHR